MEEEKAWLDEELAGGGKAKEVDESLDNNDEDVVMDFADEGEDDGTGIECQCCFADYPFVMTFLLSPFYVILTFRPTVQMVQCPEAQLTHHTTRLSQLLSDLCPPFLMFSTLPHI